MAYFYQNGFLHVGAPPVSGARGQDDSKTPPLSLASITAHADRPTYVYDLDNIRLRGEALKSAFLGQKLSVHYALKANNHPAVLKVIHELGFGADTVSAGEIRLALRAGIPPSRIIFSGVGKTVREIEFAIQNQIKQINVESPQELERIILIARRMKSKVDVAFRMNPDVNPDTHPYITTGFRENKFGMDESFLPELKNLLREAPDAVRLRGLTMHIGSQLLELGSLRDALEITLRIHENFVQDGFPLDRVDIGGGIGIQYASDDESAEFAMIREYGEMVSEALQRLKTPLACRSAPLSSDNVTSNGQNQTLEVLLEPGRILVARSGLLLAEVQYIKRAPAKTFVIVNTGMHHLLRPALYGAKHRVLMVARKSLSGDVAESGPRDELHDVVGPICESSDCLARDVRLAGIEQGDWLGFADAGAYGFTMASHYNVHELPNQIAISGGEICG